MANSIFALLVLMVVLVMAEQPESFPPIGVHLGPTHLTAAYIDSTNDAVIVGTIEGSKEYRNYMQASLKYTSDQAVNYGVRMQDPMRSDTSVWTLEPIDVYLHNHTTASQIFLSELTTIKTLAEQTLSRDVNLTSIIYPDTFNTALYQALCEAASHFPGLHVRGLHVQLNRFCWPSHLAFPLMGGGDGSQDCALPELWRFKREWADFEVIVAEYRYPRHSGRRYLMMERLEGPDAVHEFKVDPVRCLALSEDGSTKRGSGSVGYVEKARKFMSGWASYRGFLIMKDLRAVVIISDASFAGGRDLREMIITAFWRDVTDTENMILRGFEPGDVAAVASARWKKVLEEYPYLELDEEPEWLTFEEKWEKYKQTDGERAVSLSLVDREKGEDR